MGAKDSKPNFITYEEAVKRVPDSELRRIREAFKRCAGSNGVALSLESFVRDVLSDGVPFEVAEWLYQACGGTKRGISFRDLLCGLVVLTKGSVDEKIKLLWTLYVNYGSDNGTYLYKRDFALALHFENNSLPVSASHKTAETLTSLFGLSEKVTYEQFRSWLLMHPDATVLARWLLSDRLHCCQDLETPTFYQSLAGVTHLEERDIIDLEKCFWSLGSTTPTGQLDLESVSALLSPPLPRAAVQGAFLAFDENRDGHIDFKELCCGLSAACRGPRTERLKFCFKMFDMDRDGVLNKSELEDMIGVLCSVANDSIKYSSRSSTPSDCSASDHGTERSFDPEVVLLNLRDKLVTVPRKPMFQLGPTGDSEVSKEEPQQTDLDTSDTVLPLEDFLIWAVESAEGVVGPFMDLLVGVCHIVLGLRPQCAHQERDIVLSWLRREVARGYSVGQFWYLVGAEWWSKWLGYCGNACSSLRHLETHGDDSDTTNSSESMGSLLWRADSASVGSASSSGVSSATARSRPHPGPIDNSRLLAPNTLKVRTLTGEGGHLRRDVTLAQHRDFELLPDGLWRALALWYGGPHPLPRQVIRPPNSDVELELYPLHLKLLRHVPNVQRVNCVAAAAVGGGGAAFVPVPPDRQLAYTAAFSRLATVRQVSEFLSSALGVGREAMRLWAVNSMAGSTLLEDETETLQSLPPHAALLIELRNADLTWPEEIGALGLASGSRASVSAGASGRRDTLAQPSLPGATGLHNLGNTCYMNAALQAVWNTGPLTRYFNSGMHLYEVNLHNPLGTKGALAMRYGELCKEVWSCSARSVAPLRVRWCVSRHARHLAGGQQHDAQELLAWLLDALHEDLNRADQRLASSGHHDSDGRPDQVVASEAWAGHIARNQSILTDLFYGQLKSKVQCDACGRDSTRFDAFNMLSLPLPMECFVRAEVTVILLDGSVPVKYGTRINADATYLELKNKLSELCGLPPEELLIVQLSGATILHSMLDTARVSPATATSLHAYQTPAASAPCDTSSAHVTPSDVRAPTPSGSEVSAPRKVSRSRCMPALFCFKRTKSETAMAGSPPSAAPSTVFRSNTLPRDLSDLKRLESKPSSPTLSVRSLNTRASPRMARKVGSLPSNLAEDPVHNGNFLIAVHRKQCRSATYFLPYQRVASTLFGTPLLVRMRPGASGRELYGHVWQQIARLLSKRPPTEQRNHATDCDDSLGYEFPFTLRVVCADGTRCAVCPWWRACTGCALPQDDTPLVTMQPEDDIETYHRPHEYKPSDSSLEVPCDSPIARVKLQRQTSGRCTSDGDSNQGEPAGELTRLELWRLRQWQRRVQLAIDWDPTALHLRYQTTRAKAWIEHPSVSECVVEASRPVDLAVCLRAFTSEERLEERYQCTSCRSAQTATKKLQIWRLPPILVVHLKRFQYVNNKWIKSQKVVNFPFQDFDPTEYLAAVPQETILRHRDILNRPRNSLFIDETISESDSDEEATQQSTKDQKPKPKVEKRRQRAVQERQRLQSTSLVNTPVTDDNLIDYHQHHLTDDQDPFDLKYRLYAVVSHSGQLHGGHYVCYARNPSGAWLCYNDSSCRVLSEGKGAAPHIDPNNAYLLFYERQGLDYEAYLPDTAGRQPVVKDCDADPDENDLRKMCVIQ